MPTIKYPKNPNVETAFVEQDDGTKNRVVLTAPQDISTIEYPNNPNSTKAYVTVNGKKQRVVMTADIAGGGGGGSVDYSKTVQKTDTMPAASASNENQVFMYTGATNASYTTNYIYRNIKTSTYTSTVTFEAATLSSSTIACSGSDFAAFVAEWGSGDITTITNGTITYDQSGGLLVFVGKDADDTTVCTFQLYTQDYQDAGFTITGTLQDGDVFAFTCSISEASATYAWTRVDVQPAPEALPSQTGNAGKFLITNGTDASWSDKPLVNNGTGTYSVGISKESVQTLGDSNINIGGYVGNANAYRNVVVGVAAKTGYNNSYYSNDSVYVGWNAMPYAGNKSYMVAIGAQSMTNANYATAIGCGASAMADGAIQLGGRGSGSQRRNSDANTFKVGNANGNYEIMSADGTIPADRLTNAINKYSTMPTAASTNEGWIVQFTGTTDANYTHGYIYECKAQGTNPETYAWEAVEVQASSGGLPSQTGNAYYFLTTNGTTASWTDQTRGFTYTKASGNNTYSIAQCGLYNDAAFSFTTGGSGFRFFVGNGVNFRMGANGFYNDSNYSLGSAIYPWAKAYISKINNGSDITVPNQAGTMVVATPPSADGTYVLKATVSSGTVTYQWVAE